MFNGFTASHRGGSGEPLVLLHGFTDTWRTWELVLPRLQKRHDVLAPTLPGHAGGPELTEPFDEQQVTDAIERAMDEAGLQTAHFAGNSLGGYLSLLMAARGRARSVVALAPAGGWAPQDDSFHRTLDHFATVAELVERAAPHADAIAANPNGRRAATQMITTNWEHIPADLIAHQIRGAAACAAMAPLVARAREHGWPLDLSAVDCPVRIVWGTEDQLLPWPSAAARYRAGLPRADWVELDGIGHCPQLDVPLETAELILGWTSA